MAETARPTRADEVRRERRNKPGSVNQTNAKLAVDESKLDRKTYEYRWVNDAGARMMQVHDREWDPAPEGASVSNDGEGSVTRKVAGVDETGKPYSAVLMRKRKDWFDEDHARKMAPLSEMDKAIRAGANHQAEPELRGEGVYTPDGGNRLDGR